MRKIRRLSLVAGAALLAAGVFAPLGAQVAALDAAVRPAAAPFRTGEVAEYQVRLGRLAVGSGSMRVLGVETVDGRATYRARMLISGGIPMARVNNRYETWIDVEQLFSRRFHQNIHEVRYRRNRTYDFFPERRSYRRQDNGETGTLPTSRPLDEIAFIYYVRTMPLRVGERYELNHYFKESGNPVVIHVVRRETVTVPAGTFNTIVVRPLIKTSGLFGEGGEAEVYFTDDERRIPVLLRSRVPLVGHLNLFLRSYTPGQSPAAAARPGP